MKSMLAALRATGGTNNSGCGFTKYYDGEYLTLRDNSSISYSAQYNVVYNNWFSYNNPENIQVFMAHARLATSGGGGGVHPFHWESRTGENKTYSFMHNGGVPVNTLLATMSNAGFNANWIRQAYKDAHNINAAPDPSTMVDSELMFYFIMGMAERTGNLESGMAQALKLINSCYGLSTSNFVLSDGTTMYAYKYKHSSSSSTNKIYYKMLSQYSYPHLVVQTMSNSFPGGQGTELPNDTLIKYSTTAPNFTTIANYSANAGEKISLAIGDNYICFTVMDGNSINANTYFSSILSDIISITHEGTTYYPNQFSTLTLYRDRGYILTMNRTVRNFLMKGYQTSPTQLVEIETGVNWLGYFNKQSSGPLVAFGTLINNISRIETDNWAMWRGGLGEWLQLGQSGATFTLDYGKMYKVTYSGPTTSFTYQVLGSFLASNDNIDVPIDIDNDTTSAKNNEITSPALMLTVAPNPTRDWTNISYSLKSESDVAVSIYNVKGQIVRSFNAPAQASGTHSITWDGKDANGKIVTNGIYLLRAQAGTISKTTRIIKIK